MPALGLFGGSFDPLHLGHLLVAQAALEELVLDRLVFLPAAQSPFKPGTTPALAAARLRMLRQSLAGQVRMSVDDLEIRRGGVSFTVETCREFSRRLPGWRLLWLIGADHVPTLPLWRDAEQLARIVEFIIIPRPGEPQATLPPPYRLHPLRGWPLKVSSSEIRDRVKAGLPIHHLVPAVVAEVIECENLYRPILRR
ncbi:MAG: nicotinate (nicotinamide) nucleotide adenylyltransferase [Pedosphaera sp.]|nr:nicotinate (nicotinamide) nucleotide adenylyltransferase [Pedosphaera sp.]